jgi:SAM-dependent methyltransferase
VALAELRARLRLRQRFRDPLAVKHDAELQWWQQHWDPVLRAGGFNPGDAPGLLDGEPVADTYIGRRWQQARAEVARVLAEAAIEDPGFFAGKVVVDIGPGPLGFPDACPARVSIGVDPLAERYAASGLLLPDSPALYLTAGAEAIPLVSACADVVLARNSLDHVDDPAAAVAEMRRILRPQGTLILGVDIDHPATTTEPHTISERDLATWLEGFQVVSRAHRQASGPGGTAAVLRAVRSS